MNTCHEIGVVNSNEIPVFEYASQVDYFMGIANMVNKHTEEMVQTAVLVPGGAVVPQGDNANQFPLEANNTTLSVPDGQVVPGYVSAGGATNSVMVADSTQHCDFLIVRVVNGVATCQSTGIIRFPQGHQYQVVGAQYYLSSTPGQVTTDATQTGKKLFKVISRTQLLINM